MDNMTGDRSEGQRLVVQDNQGRVDCKQFTWRRGYKSGRGVLLPESQ